MKPVNMVPSLPVVQSIETEPETLEEVDSILWLHHIILVRLQEKYCKIISQESVQNRTLMLAPGANLSAASLAQ